MRPTEVLKNEHEAIKLMLRITDAVCNKIESGEVVDPDDLAAIVDFIHGLADECHHGKEENLLFKEMEKAGFPREGGPIGVMLAEHAKGRDYVARMRRAVTGLREKEPNAQAMFVENARGYVQLLTNHIHKENNILFPMADQRLPSEIQKKLEEEFERFEREETGVEKHEEYHQLLHRLSDIYLK